LTGCQQDKVASLTDALPDQVVFDFILDESMSGKRLYNLYALRAVVWGGDSRIDVDSVRIIFYDENSIAYSELTADQGVVFTRTENLIARGNCVVATADSTTLFTDSLLWDNSRQIVWTDADIIISTAKGTIVGKGLVADAQLTKIEIKSEVRGTANYEFKQ